MKRVLEGEQVKSERPPKQVTYDLDDDVALDPREECVDQLVYEEELMDMMDEKQVNEHGVLDFFRNAFESSEREIGERKRIKRNNKALQTLQDLEDFYGEEDDGDVTAMDTSDFDARWNFLDPTFLVHNHPSLPDECPYTRPEVDQSVGTAADDFVYQHTETTYRIDPDSRSPEILLWGVNQRGHSVLTRVQGFNPYFYVAVDTQHEMDLIRPRLEKHLMLTAPRKFGEGYLDRYIDSIEQVQGRTICGYHMGKPLQSLFKITLTRPSFVPIARKCFDFGNRAVLTRSYTTFEANVPFELRYMVDTKLYGCQWMQLNKKLYARSADCISNAQYEFTVRHDVDFPPISPIKLDDKGDIAPIRFLSYDIEVFRKEQGFPTPDKNPVVNICCALDVTGVGVVHKAVFTLKPVLDDERWGTHNPIEGADVYEYEDERHLLMAFSQYVQDCDPDGLTGWNTSSFDMPYLAKRAQVNGIFDSFMSFGRLLGKPAWLREKVFQSKAYGAKKNTELMCAGRFDFDGLIFMLRGQMKKYRSYKLNHIAEKVLNDTKLDVDYSQIPILYESDDDADRTRLAHYCLKDALLPLQILQKLMAVVNGVEQARVTGVSFKWLLSKGQGIKTFSNLLRHKLADEYVPTMSPRSSTGETSGGYVEEPRRGHYPMPVITLDFSSLYPSIMIAHNICYTTKVSRTWAEQHLKPDDYWSPFPAVDGGTPTQFVFVKKHIREGILPKLLAGLLQARRDVKEMMKTEADAFIASVLNGRQLALKVVCNSVYGFLKAFILRDKDLMSAVTSYGRNMIYQVKHVIERDFQNVLLVDVEKCLASDIDPEVEPAEGAKDPRVYSRFSGFIVYGDTDSVMVSFGDLRGKRQRKKMRGGQTSLNSFFKRERVPVEYDDAPQKRHKGFSADDDSIVPKHIILKECIRLGKAMAAQCTAEFQAPNSLTFETIKLRGAWLNKKRYCALEIEKFIEGERMADAIKRASISVKGLEGKRRDNAFINSATQNEIIRILLVENDVPKMERFIESRIRDLLMGRVDISELVITKGLAKTDEQYAKGGSKQQHVELKKRMAKRAHFTGEVVPETGDRVPYIVRASTSVAKSSKHAEKACDLSEHPLYAMRNGVPINTEYYINKQIWPAVSRIMTCVYEPGMCPKIESNMSDKVKKTLKVYKRFFAPNCAHMQSVKRQRVGEYEMAKFTQVLSRCLGCGTRVSDGATCKVCNAQDVRARLESERAETQKRADDAWDICRKCQGGSFNKVTCSNLTCNNFFHREQMLMDVEDLATKLKRF